MQSDLSGPVQTSSFGQKRYFRTFIDKFIKWVKVYAISRKSDAFKAFHDYITKHERLTNKKHKYFRTDNGIEFNEISKYCKENGINHQKTAPYAHEQAGLGERINLILLDKIRSLLFTAKLNLKF